MKRAFALLFSTFLVMICFPPASFCLPDGDIAPLGSPDGQVNVGDALVALRFALSLETPTQGDRQHGDVSPLDIHCKPNPDGQINVGDALVILRKALGLVNWPAPENDPNIDDDNDGYTDNQGDCNDGNVNLHPGATEICGDGIDQDCDGNDLPCNFETWLGDGLRFIVTDNSTIEDLEYTYEGTSDCYNCRFTIERLSIISSQFSLSNNTVGFHLDGSFHDPTHMTADVTVSSSGCPLTHKTISAEIDPSGTVVHSFDSPGSWPNGLAYDGRYLWNADAYTHKIYKLDMSGNVIASFDSPGYNPRGLAYDGTYLWNADLSNKIYKLDMSGNVIASFDSPGSSPRGLAYDGTYLWNADHDRGKIYQISLR
jgi:hypothetical protein